MNHRDLTVGERVACAARALSRTPETLAQRTGLSLSLINAIYADQCDDLTYVDYLAKPLAVSEVWLKTGKINRHKENSAVQLFLQSAKETCADIKSKISGDVVLPESTPGERLMLLRKSLGMTALHVQKKTRIPADTVRDFEQGLQTPSDKQTYFLSRALKSTVEWIERGEGQPFRPNEHEVDHEHAPG